MSTSNTASTSATVPNGTRREFVDLQEMDMILGHSNKFSVHKHPGNVHFHKLIEKYCQEYVSTPIHLKNNVTNKVIVGVEAVGGRFVKSEGDRFLLCDERAAAGKVTKHLRERGAEKQEAEQDIHQAQDQARMNRSTSSSQDYLSPKRRRIQTTGGASSAVSGALSPRNGLKIWNDTHGLPSNKYNAPTTLYYDEDDSSNSSSDEDGRIRSQTIWQKLERNSDRIETDSSWNIHYKKLQDFYSKNGHSGVSPDWDGDNALAEWASKQRQLFREIQMGYRIATLREESRFKQLQLLNFPLNYENWHWERKYSQLKDILDGEKFTKSMITDLPEKLQTWLKHQQELLKAEAPTTAKTLEKDKRERLKCLGV
jgi:hypothetical protein